MQPAFLVFTLHCLILILTATLASEVHASCELSLCLVIRCDECPGCCGGPALHIERGASDGQTKITRARRSSERLSDLCKVAQVNGKGGIWSPAARLQNHSVSPLTCMNPMQSAHPSTTAPSSASYGILDQDIFFFASF